ncbi:MAG: hypothetical protein AAF063_36860 [Cyanobacteria bacterium J06643_5]
MTAQILDENKLSDTNKLSGLVKRKIEMQSAKDNISSLSYKI